MSMFRKNVCFVLLISGVFCQAQAQFNAPGEWTCSTPGVYSDAYLNCKILPRTFCLDGQGTIFTRHTALRPLVNGRADTADLKAHFTIKKGIYSVEDDALMVQWDSLIIKRYDDNICEVEKWNKEKETFEIQNSSDSQFCLSTKFCPMASRNCYSIVEVEDSGPSWNELLSVAIPKREHYSHVKYFGNYRPGPKLVTAADSMDLWYTSNSKKKWKLKLNDLTAMVSFHDFDSVTHYFGDGGYSDYLRGKLVDFNDSQLIFIPEIESRSWSTDQGAARTWHSYHRTYNYDTLIVIHRAFVESLSYDRGTRLYLAIPGGTLYVAGYVGFWYAVIADINYRNFSLEQFFWRDMLVSLAGMSVGAALVALSYKESYCIINDFWHSRKSAAGILTKEIKH